MFRIFFLFIFIFQFGKLFSQDTYFSQYNSFPLWLDKSLAGSAGCSRIVTGTRLQWLGLDGGYKTYYFSYDQYSRHLHSGFGVEYYHSDESNGTIMNDFAYGTFSPSISIGKRGEDSLRPIVIKPAINFGILRHEADYSKTNMGDQIDPYYGFIYGHLEPIIGIQKVIAPDFGTGFSVYGKNFVAGFYCHHLLQPDIALIGTNALLYRRNIFHASYLLKDFKWLGKFSLVPSFLYESQGNEKRTEISLVCKYKYYSLGVSERFASSVIFKAGFENKFLKVGYAYDLNTTAVHAIVGATHEIILGFKFLCREKFKKIRTVKFSGF